MTFKKDQAGHLIISEKEKRKCNIYIYKTQKNKKKKKQNGEGETIICYQTSDLQEDVILKIIQLFVMRTYKKEKIVIEV